MPPISFTARYIRPADIKKLNGDSYRPHVAALVEMELADSPVVERVAYDWMQPISDQIAEKTKELNNDGVHLYAVTNQKNNFKELDSNKILGMMLFKEGGANKTHNTIELLQVSPFDMSPKYGSKLRKTFNKLTDLIFKSREPEHKHIGQSLLDGVKDMFGEKPIDLYAADDAIEFYIINGFHKMKGLKNRFLNHMEWRK